jgi:DNA polymerase delta subunit 3
MLYEFHRKQNSKKPGSVHATYLVSGTKRPATTSSSQDDEDMDMESSMRSSPPLPSSSLHRPDDQDEVAEVIAVRGVMLVREEHLEEAKAQFESISGMHIYSLQANGVSDVQVLTECNRRVAAEYATEDPLKEWKQYGVVQNPDVRRRTRGQPPPPPPAKSVPAAKSTATAVKSVGAAPTAKSAAVEKQADGKPAAKNVPPQKNTPNTASKPAANKNQNSSIFKSFAKGSANAKKKAESQGSSAAASPAAEPEDVPMTGFSDDEDDADVGLPAELEEVKVPAGESKNERKSRLEAMMDEEDEAMEDAATPVSVESPHDDGAIDVVEKEEPKETVVVENGRRRGRRRVMKKKTVKDEDGYLGELPFLPILCPRCTANKHNYSHT